MIDEKRLIERIKWSLIAIKGHGTDLNYKEVIEKDKLLKIINEQPKVGEWIPCSERLPSISGRVLITYRKLNKGEINVGIDRLVNGKNGCNTHWQGHGNRVIAWMELPPAYKGE